ncbi:MAG: DUF3040 domain-containing protein, partial [Streptosporangiaceae bacterium]
QAVVGFVLGVGLLVAGVAIKDLWIGVAGFVVMLACSMWALSSYRHMTGISTGRGLARERQERREHRGRGRGRAARAPSQGMMERLEERWRRRQERDR